MSGFITHTIYLAKNRTYSVASAPTVTVRRFRLFLGPWCGLIWLPADGEESVHVVDRKAEDLGLAAQLLAHLQHPVIHNLAHVRLNVRLHVAEVVRLHRHVPDNRGK